MSTTQAETAEHTTKHKPRNQGVNFNRFLDMKIHVKFVGGREIEGVLKGYDKLMNLVLDECVEFLRDEEDPYRLSGKTRNLGLLVVRGINVTTMSPVEGREEIQNPFLEEAELASQSIA